MTPPVVWITVIAAAFVVLAIAAGVAVWIRWLWTQYPQSHRALVATLSATVVLTVLGQCATVAGVVKAFGAVDGDSVDPSQKARVLAEGISEAMNCSVLGLLPLLAIPFVLLTFTWHYPRRTRGQSGSGPNRPSSP